MFTVLDLFSGIGGFALATEWAGGRTVAFAETAEFPSKVLAERFPGVPNLGDVRKLCRRIYDCKTTYDEDGYTTDNVWCPRCDMPFDECECIGADEFLDEYGSPDVVTAGVPCQPASAVGRMRGDRDERWMWPDTLRIVRELSPRFVLAENPPSLLRLDGGRAFAGILHQFAKMRYDVLWEVVPASAVGAGHRRERLWIVAADTNCPRLEGYAGHGETRRKAQAHRHPAARYFRQGANPGPRWYRQSGIQPVVDGLPGRVARDQLEAVGNAVVPQLAFAWLSAFAEILAMYRQNRDDQ
ncbi:MAG: hypothetical protein D6692_08570 [Planctomycetota bacterium]|nr:MAG: hypothetical protein D6692_08570 [Planctomycetota bacterium]